jgi:hypothetical protein
MFDAKRKKWNRPSACVLAVALVLILALAFAGCGSTGADGSDTDSGSTSADSGETGGDSASSNATDDTGAGGGEGEPVSDEAASPDGAAPVADAEVIDSGGFLTFDVSAVTEQASFFPLTVDGTYMEVIAVRAPDDTVRTAFNTCQVCWDSGYGYYVQEADELVCQNCGNRFNVSDVEIVRGGCNPVPIEEEYKTVNGESVSIGYDLLKEAVPLFEYWKS